MSNASNQPENNDSPTIVAAVLAQFDSAEAVKAAAASVRAAGYARWDVHSPFPIHGIERAMGIRPTRLPWLVLAAGVVGMAAALLLQWWTNAVDYPTLISGKPLFSLPANIPVTFELIVLFSAFAAFFGTLALTRLPQFVHPTFASERFRRATSDRFFLSIEAADAKFDEADTREFLLSLEPAAVEICRDAPGSGKLPAALLWTAAIVILLAMLPPLLIARARQVHSESPRLHLVNDMDFQPKYKTQAQSEFFADRRTMRPDVPDTLAVGAIDRYLDDHYYLGYRPKEDGEQAVADPPAEDAAPPDAAEDGEGPVAVAAPTEEVDYYATFPQQVIDRADALMQRGRQRYDIFCATCHGLDGTGEGMASVRAFERQEPAWVAPVSLHAGSVLEQPVGQIFGSITHGVRKMPAYGPIIPVEDRWAIVLYVRALQRSRNAAADDVPQDIRLRLQ